MDFRFTAHDPQTGAFLHRLPRPEKVQIGDTFGTRGTLELTYSAKALNAKQMPTFVEIRQEVTHDGGQTWAQIGPHYLRLSGSHEDTDQAGMRTVKFVSREWLLGKARVGEGDLPLIDGKRPFYQSSPGTIIRTLILEAKDRGAAQGIEIGDFTADVDSSGNDWPKVATIYYSPGLPILNVLENLVEQGMCDYRMDGNAMRLYAPETTMGRDLTTGTDPVRVHGHVTEAPVNYTLEDLTTSALLIGEDGFEIEVDNPSAPDDYGRLEATIEQGGVSDEGTARVMIDETLQKGSREIREITRTQLVDGLKHVPYRDYRVGDFVQVRDQGAWERYRVREIQLVRDKDGWTAHTVINDRLQELLLKLAKRTSGIVNGSSGSGGDGTPPARPPRPGIEPAAPEGLVVDQQVYLDRQGIARGQITASWSPVTESVRDKAIDIGGYELWWRRNETYAEWTRAVVTTGDDTTVTHSPVVLSDVDGNAMAYQWKVRATAEESARPGPFSDIVTLTMTQDTTPPPPPSMPGVVTDLRIITVDWDGLDEDGEAMPVDFNHVRVYFGSAKNMADAERAGYLTQAGSWNSGSMEPDTPVWVAISAVDNVGNESAMTEAQEVTPRKLVDDDSIRDELNTIDDKIKDAQDELQSDIDAIAESANGKNKVTYSPRRPTEDDEGVFDDTWFVGQFGRKQDEIELTNLVTNPSFELSAGDLAISDGVSSVYRSTGVNGILQGSSCLGVTGASSGITTSNAQIAFYTAPGIDPGQHLGWGWSLRRSSPGEDLTVSVGINWYSETGFISSEYREYLTMPTGSAADPANRRTVAFLAPEGVHRARMILRVRAADGVSPAPAEWQFHTDGWSAIAASTESGALEAAATFFDGDTKDGELSSQSHYRWVGAEHDSVSEKYLPATEFGDSSSWNVLEQYRHDGAEWERVELSHEVISTLDAGKIVVGFLDGGRIRAGSVEADTVLVPGSAGSTVIRDGAVTTDKILANAITAGKIAALAIEADHISANAITADKIRAGAIDGKLITGARIRTAASGRRTELDVEGLRSYDTSGNVTLTTATADGSVDMRGNLTQLIKGVTMSVGDNFAGVNPGISWTDTNNYATPPGVIYGEDAGARNVYLQGPGTATDFSGLKLKENGDGFNLFSQSGSRSWRINTSVSGNYFRAGSSASNAPYMLMRHGPTGTGYLRATYKHPSLDKASSMLSLEMSEIYLSAINSNGNLISRLWGDNDGTELSAGTRKMGVRGGNGAYMDFVNTSNGPRVQSGTILSVTSDGGWGVRVNNSGTLFSESSSLRYKQDVSPARVMPDILDVEPKSWRNKATMENSAKLAALREEIGSGPVPEYYAEAMNESEVPWQYGAIAEEVDGLGLTELVLYDKYGRPDALQYEKFGVALIPIIRRLRDRVDALEQQLGETA